MATKFPNSKEFFGQAGVLRLHPPYQVMDINGTYVPAEETDCFYHPLTHCQSLQVAVDIILAKEESTSTS